MNCVDSASGTDHPQGPEIRGVRDHIHTTYGPKIDCVTQVDF